MPIGPLPHSFLRCSAPADPCMFSDSLVRGEPHKLNGTSSSHETQCVGEEEGRNLSCSAPAEPHMFSDSLVKGEKCKLNRANRSHETEHVGKKEDRNLSCSTAVGVTWKSEQKKQRRLNYGPSCTTLVLHRRLLVRMAGRLVRAHKWTQASGILSLLCSEGASRKLSMQDQRKIFLAAMELQKRGIGFPEGTNVSRTYCDRIKNLYAVWLQRLPGSKKSPKARQMVQLELALFALLQGDMHYALTKVQRLQEEYNSKCEPVVNLMHGLMAYHLWYSGLPEDIRIDGFDVFSQSNIAFNSMNDNEHPPSCESSYSENEDELGNNKASPCSSEISISSVNNCAMSSKRVTSMERNFPADNVSFEEPHMDKTEGTSHNLQNLHFLLCGLSKGTLDRYVLPIRWNWLLDNLPASLGEYWKCKESSDYSDAVKFLEVALISTPPLTAALLPLVQLKLLGGDVKGALSVLERVCDRSSTPFGFRLRAIILEYVHYSQPMNAAYGYEEALRRDPTCASSIEKIIKMHRNGDYSNKLLLEAIALHLDSANGKSIVWEELAYGFRRFSSSEAAYEDCSSVNIEGDVTFCSPTDKILGLFNDVQTRESWKVRCRWWRSRHFSKKVFLSEIQGNDSKLLASKAACASHLYGPDVRYIDAVRAIVPESELAFLHEHTQQPLKLLEKLDGDAS